MRKWCPCNIWNPSNNQIFSFTLQEQQKVHQHEIWTNKPSRECGLNAALINAWFKQRDNSKSGVNDEHPLSGCCHNTGIQCALDNTLLKSPYSSLCSGNSDPLFTIAASNYDTAFSLPPSPWPVQAGSWVVGVISKTIPPIRDGYIEAILCLSGERQTLYLVQNKHTYIFSGDRLGIKGAVLTYDLIKNQIMYKNTWGWKFMLVFRRTEFGDNRWLRVSSRLRSCTRQESSKDDSVSKGKMINSLIKPFYWKHGS